MPRAKAIARKAALRLLFPVAFAITGCRAQKSDEHQDAKSSTKSKSNDSDLKETERFGDTTTGVPGFPVPLNGTNLRAEIFKPIPQVDPNSKDSKLFAVFEAILTLPDGSKVSASALTRFAIQWKINPNLSAFFESCSSLTQSTLRCVVKPSVAVGPPIQFNVSFSSRGILGEVEDGAPTQLEVNFQTASDVSWNFDLLRQGCAPPYFQVGRSSNGYPICADAKNYFLSVAAKNEGGVAVVIPKTNSTSTRVWAWGNRAELGNKSLPSTAYSGYVETALGVNLESVEKVAAGRRHACALAATPGTNADKKSIYCWGHNVFGQVNPNSTSDNIELATPISGFTEPIIDLFTGPFQTCALVLYGTPAVKRLRCWGLNDGYMFSGASESTPTAKLLGNKATTAAKAGPVLLDVIANAATTDIHGISFTYLNACVVVGTGNVECFGRGRTVRGTRDAATVDFDKTTVIQTSTGSGPLTDVQSVHLAESRLFSNGDYTQNGHACANTRSGHMYCWGENDFGQLGIGNSPAVTDSFEATPARNAEGALVDKVTAVSLGGHHSFFLSAIGDESGVVSAAGMIRRSVSAVKKWKLGEGDPTNNSLKYDYFVAVNTFKTDVKPLGEPCMPLKGRVVTSVSTGSHSDYSATYYVTGGELWGNAYASSTVRNLGANTQSTRCPTHIFLEKE